jgi:hypothetical protein
MQSSRRRIVLAVADAMFESDAASVVEDVLVFVRAASFATRATLHAALWLLRLAPILMFVSWRPLDHLDRDRRRALLVRIERTPIGLALVAWRTLLVLHFYEDARELARIGYREERKRHLAVIPPPAVSGLRLRDDAFADEHDEKGAA